MRFGFSMLWITRSPGACASAWGFHGAATRRSTSKSLESAFGPLIASHGGLAGCKPLESLRHGTKVSKAIRHSDQLLSILTPHPVQHFVDYLVAEGSLLG